MLSEIFDKSETFTYLDREFKLSCMTKLSVVLEMERFVTKFAEENVEKLKPAFQDDLEGMASYNRSRDDFKQTLFSGGFRFGSKIFFQVLDLFEGMKRLFHYSVQAYHPDWTWKLTQDFFAVPGNSQKAFELLKKVNDSGDVSPKE